MPEKIDNNPLLINDLLSNRVYLMNKKGEVLYEWPLGSRKLANDFSLLSDGRTIASFRAENPRILLGGYGGINEIMSST